MDKLTPEERCEADKLLNEIMSRYDRVITSYAIKTIRVCGDTSFEIEDVKQDIYLYIMQFSLNKFMITDNWLPNIKMMSRNACANFLQSVKTKKRRTNQYTIAEEICETSLGFFSSPQETLEFIESVEYLPALRRDMLMYLATGEKDYGRFSVAKIAKFFNLSPTRARKEYLTLQAELSV